MMIAEFFLNQNARKSLREIPSRIVLVHIPVGAFLSMGSIHPLRFLAQIITKATLASQQPVNLTALHLLWIGELPILWREQLGTRDFKQFEYPKNLLISFNIF